MKAQKQNKKRKQLASTTPEDERFKQVFTDPRFMQVPSKIKKVEIDDRFKKGITSKEFNTVAKVDKYGRRIDKQDNSMLKFYNLDKDNTKKKQKKAKKQESESEEEDEQVEQDQEGNKYYDEEGKFKWDAQSSSEDEDEEDGEEKEDQSDDSSDMNIEQESEDEEDDSIWSLKDENEGQQLDQVVIGKRLALTNMDWDNINSVDILALFSSFCKGDMFIEKVEIYPSLFGLEQMKKDSLYGPPKEVLSETPVKNTKKLADVVDDPEDYIDDEEKEKLGYNSSKLRKYEVQKMKYFYAVVHCNSQNTASKIFEEYNGYEFEMSNIRLNLSFIADDLTFPQQMKEQATEIPAGYEFKASNNLNKALNHTNVRLTWDQTDPKRIEKFQKLLEKDDSDIDEEEYKEFLGSASDDEDDYGAEQDRDKIEEYRKKLLGALSGTSEDISSVFRKRDLQEGDEDDKELDIKFNVGFGEDVGKKLLSEKKEKKEREGESEWQKYQRKRKEKRKEKKLQQKLKKQQGRQEVFEEGDAKKKAELELLIGETNNGMGEFKANTKDARFQAVLKDKDFAIDPTHKNYKKIAESEFVREQQNKRRKLHEQS